MASLRDAMQASEILGSVLADRYPGAPKPGSGMAHRVGVLHFVTGYAPSGCGGGVIWAFGEFELDEDRCELRRSGQVVELRRKVFDVLRYLVAHGNRLVSKEELLSGVWPGETIHEAVIAQNVAILRRALGDSRQAATAIQTVHGRGYRFVAAVTLQAPLAAPSTALDAPPVPRLPFVGREQVMQELERLLEAARAGSGRFGVITGEAGIGKTRTLEELASAATARGVRVLEGRCHEGEGAPAYWPWKQILQAAAREGERALFSDLSRSEPLDSADARFRLFESITAYLSRIARAQPLLLIFDDLHWADEATLHLLRFLSREVRALPLLVLGTSRDPDSHAAPTGALLSSLIGGTHVHRIYLSGLSPTATRELVATTLDRDLGEPTLRELHALTEGNPFFVHEIARLFAGDAAGAAGGGDWRLCLPRRVREVIGLRMQTLGPTAQRVLSLASVIGRDFSVAVLEQVAELPRAELLGLLEAATRARIVSELDARSAGEGPAPAPPGHYRFAHALIRESLYGALPEPERVRLHEQVGRTLEALFGVDAEAHVSELAQHFYRAASGGDVERAVAYCTRAAEQALDTLAFEQAVFHYRRALEALACRLPIDEQRRFSLKLALGSAQFRAGEDGNSALLGAAEIARRLTRPDLLGHVVLAMCGWPRVHRRGRTANREFYPLLTEALAAPLDNAPVLHARLLSQVALNCPEETAPAQQIALSREALDHARALAHDEALHDALLPRLYLTQAPEDTALRLSLATELLEVAERLGHKERIFTAHELRAQPLLALGDLPGADREIERCEQLAHELRLPRCALVVQRLRLERALGDGRFDEIRSLTKEAVQIRGPAEASPGYRVSLFMWRTFERTLRGDRAWFDRHIDGMAAEACKAYLMRSHVAYLFALFGRLAEARACYQPLLELDALDRPRDDGWLMMYSLTAEAAALCGDRAAAELLYPRLLPHAALNVTHFEWLIYLGSCEHWLGLLAALLGKRDAAVAHYEAALAMNAKIGARSALARTSIAYARLLDGGDSSFARRLSRDAGMLAHELGMHGVLHEARMFGSSGESASV
jgi:DNA-binding winged helix-turn-helix (wHTH) protein